MHVKLYTKSELTSYIYMITCIYFTRKLWDL